MPLRRRPRSPRLLSLLSPSRVALVRTGLGVVMLARPRLVPDVLGADPAVTARSDWAVRMLGAREVALGLGALQACRSGDRRAARPWLLAGVLSDGTDALVLSSALGAGRLGGTGVRTALVAAAAGGAVAAALAQAAELRR